MKSDSLLLSLTLALLSLSTPSLATKPPRYIDFCNCSDLHETNTICDLISLGTANDANIGLTSRGVFRSDSETGSDDILYYDPTTVVRRTTMGGKRVCQMDYIPEEDAEYWTVTMRELFVANYGGEECAGLRCWRGRWRDTRA